MPKPPIHPIPNEGDLFRAVNQLNLFYSDESMWFETWAKKPHVDLFDVPIPIDAKYYKRSIGMSRRPLMILSEQSLSRLYHCLFTANAKIAALAKDLEEKEQFLIEERDRPVPGGHG